MSNRAGLFILSEAKNLRSFSCVHATGGVMKFILSEAKNLWSCSWVYATSGARFTHPAEAPEILRFAQDESHRRL
ncbi:MAG: hypothetical protein QOI24_562 [Acidobacteriota bacterium]|jgi:hypothetical protein|nr:hypothetical protein [Acidobacteriota bacterium]